LTLDVRASKTVDSIGREPLDSIVDDGFFTYGWLKTLEISKPPINLDPFYIAAYDKDNLAAFTPCFRDIADQYFQYGPDVIPFMKRTLKITNRFHIGQEHVLLCYSPWCFRTKVFFLNNVNKDLILQELCKKIDFICRSERILFSSFLFVSEFDTSLVSRLENLGYHKFSFWKPMLYLDVCWSDFDDYLKSLKGQYRYQVRREIRSCAENGVTIEEVSDFEDLAKTLSDLSLNLFSKYNKWTQRLEPFFYETLSKYAKDNTVVFLAKKKDNVVGFSLFIRKGETLDAFLGGFNYNFQEKLDFTYFNLVYYVPVKWAIQEGIRKIYYRWGSEEGKYKRGCKPENLYNFVKCHNRLFNSQIGNYVKIRNTIQINQQTRGD
jgi:predicted N-acyltransferase